MAQIRLILFVLLFTSAVILEPISVFAEDPTPKCIYMYGAKMKVSVISLLRHSYGERVHFFELDQPVFDDMLLVGMAGGPPPTMTLILEPG